MRTTKQALEQSVEVMQALLESGFIGEQRNEIIKSIAVVSVLLEELNTITNMVDFATWHAVDGMSPALDKDEILENTISDEDYYVQYDKQRKHVDRVRKLLGLPAETKWSNIDLDIDDDYASNMPCDTYGMCAGSSCSRLLSGECDGK